MEVVLYVACALYLWGQCRTRVYARYTLAYITLLLVVESTWTGVQARTVQLMYVDNRNYPGGPYAYFDATQQLAVNVAFEATLFVMTFLCDCLVVCFDLPYTLHVPEIELIFLHSVLEMLGNLVRNESTSRLPSHWIPCHHPGGIFR